jgi:Carbohydrate family 9 binding domain-like
MLIAPKIAIRLQPHFSANTLTRWMIQIILLAALAAGTGLAADNQVLKSSHLSHDATLETDPASAFWLKAPRVFAERDSYGKPVPGYRTEIRSRWTKDNLYLLFICPYEELHLKPSPDTVNETNQLWNWDVAEAFIGSDFQNIKRYKEFELSPQGEWIDLDINLEKPHHEDGWIWNSGFQVSARIDQAAHIWYGAMRIPMTAIDSRPPAPGNALRVNFFRSQGPPPHRKEVTWQSPMTDTFHAPERFGLLKLVK